MLRCCVSGDPLFTGDHNESEGFIISGVCSQTMLGIITQQSTGEPNFKMIKFIRCALPLWDKYNFSFSVGRELYVSVSKGIPFVEDVCRSRSKRDS